MQWHIPAAEVDHLGVHGAVGLIKRRCFQHR
jgi:hypothetical protein